MHTDDKPGWTTLLAIFLMIMITLNIAQSVMAQGRTATRDCWGEYERFANKSLSDLEACHGEYSVGHPYSSLYSNPFRFAGCTTGWLGRSVSGAFQFVSCSSIPTR